MPTLDDAIRFFIDCLVNPRRPKFSTFGYGVYLPEVVRRYALEVENRPDSGEIERHLEELSPVFYDAAWELCRRGILRPGLIRSGAQATMDGGSGDGYTVTFAGREWLAAADELALAVMEPGNLSRLIARFQDRLGDGYFQRAQEAVRCYFAQAHLACCAMSGAAAESIMLHVAIAKSGNEEEVLRTYRSANGRSRVENQIVGQALAPLANQFRNLMDLLKYWRDEAAHGGISDISEFEANEALARLLRLAHFVDDHWDELTAQP